MGSGCADRGVRQPDRRLGARAVVDCLREGVLTSCGTTPAELAKADPPYRLISAVGPFPVLQYLPAVALTAVGFSPGAVLTFLSLVSVASFLVLVWLLWLVGRRVGGGWGSLLVAVAFTGPLLYYAHSTFGEMAAAALVLAAVAAVLFERQPALVFGAVLVAGLTKEIAPVFVFALVAIATLTRSGGRRPTLIAAGAGAILAALANAAFNVFRYGELTNRDYLDGAHIDLYRIESVPLVQKLEYFVTLIAAPNGGLLFFWTSAAAVLALVVACAIVAVRRGAWLPLAVGVLFVLITASLASWYQPFGWFAGDRG